MRVMMIGLDAASLEFITRARTSLPTLRRLLDTGTRQRLRSRSAELFPASVWPSFYTGMPPGRHGVYYPLQWDHTSMSLRPAIHLLSCTPFWVDLEERGYRIVALDVPATWRSRLRRGVEITDWATHDETQGFSAQPRELGEQLRRALGARTMGPEIPVAKSAAQLRRLRDEVIASAARKGACIKWLLGRQDWDLFITVFGETHRAGHLFWPAPGNDESAVGDLGSALLECYQAVDRAIGDVVAAGVDANTLLVVFSVHSMGPNDSQEHFMRPLMNRINARFGTSGVKAQPQTSRGVVQVLRERLPARLQHTVGRAVPLGWRDAVVSHAVTSGYDWPRTPGIAILASVAGFVRFNLRGRETAGMLDAGSEMHRRYVGWLKEALYSCRFANTGEPVVKEVALTSEEFAGERSVYLPDAVVVWAADRVPASRITSDALGVIEAKPATGRAGNHRPDGFTIIVDPRHQHAGEAPDGDIVNLAPMVQRFLNARR